MSPTHWPIAPHPCPACHESLEVATEVSPGPPPEPGNLTVCLYCSSLLVFTETGLRAAQRSDVDALSMEEWLEIARAAVAAQRARRVIRLKEID